MRHDPYRAARGVLTGALLVVTIAPRAGVAEEVRLDGPDVVSFEHLNRGELVSSRRFVRVGVRAEGGCRYAREPLTLRAGELPPGHAMAEAVRAHDLVNCRELVERGVIRDAASAPRDSAGEATFRGSGTLRLEPPASAPPAR